MWLSRPSPLCGPSCKDSPTRPLSPVSWASQCPTQDRADANNAGGYRQTNFNVAISVLSLFVLVVKMTACVMHIWYPLLALLFNVGMTALYTTSTYGQMGPDYADPNHPSPIAWYIAKPCTVAANQEIQKYCRMAKGTFAATVYML